ncbi:MAG: glycosyltransferase [Lachnospiraceae bacterium]|nr:glycosyltransferase [Lachnospiraceae bacterium]
MAENTKVSKLKTSVVMTTYNGEKFLPEMLESLKDQTRETDEAVIVDDWSTDGTVHLVREYIEKYDLNKRGNIIDKVNIDRVRQ